VALALVETAPRVAEARGCGATFIELEVVGFFNDSFAYGVSPDGAVAVGRNSLAGPACQGNCEAWAWSTRGPGGPISPPGTNAQAHAASFSGEVITGVMLGGGGSFVWSAATGFQPLPLLPGTDAIEALDISGDGGRIAGIALASSGEQALLIENGEPMGLGTLPGGIASAANAIAIDGSTIVGYSRSSSALSSRRPFRWTSDGGMESLGELPEGVSWATATAVSADGSRIAGSIEGSKGFFLWSSSTGAVRLPPHSGSVTGISGDGSIVIGIGQLVSNDPTGAIIWDAVGGARFLHTALDQEWGVSLPGWSLSSVDDISADGRTLVGFGWNPQSARRAWAIVRQSPPFADLDGDCEVGASDLRLLLAAWGASSGAADLNGDAIVDGEDIGLLLGAWSSAARAPGRR